MSSLIMPPKRSGQHGGDPRMSEKLKYPLLAHIGREDNRVFFNRHGLPREVMNAWLDGSRVLRDDLQVKVRAILGWS